MTRPEAARRYQVPGTWGYVDRIGVQPGERVRFHISAPAKYELTVTRLGRTAILDPSASVDADRDEAEVLARRSDREAAPQTIGPGSYAYIEGDPIKVGASLTLGSWVRLWRLPVIDTIQWAWSGLITDLDYPEACRFALLIDQAGRPAVYAGDGGSFRHEWLHLIEHRLEASLGRWVHLAATIASDEISLFVDGHLVHRAEGTAQTPAATGSARLRVGASAERGAAAGFLNGDIAAPFVGDFSLTEERARRIFDDRGRTPIRAMGLGPLHASWSLSEERGIRVRDDSGNDRHGIVVNGGTWQIGGPAHDASKGIPGYEPSSDSDRGHALRFSSDDLIDCEWPVTDEFLVPETADSGLYAAMVQLEGQDARDAVPITFAVVRTRPRRPNSVALLLATNTWYAYGRRPTDELPVAGLSASFYSNHVSGRPFFQVAFRAPIPRANPYGFDSERAAYTGSSHLVRPERYAESWLHREGYAYEVITDQQLHDDPTILRSFGALMIVGHSEYWSDQMRDGVAEYLADGGRVLSMSGNTLYWRVTFDPELEVIESRKTTEGEDRRWLSPDEWGERWHTGNGGPGGTFRLVGRPGWEVLGLDTQGMLDDGTPTSFSPLTVLAPDHFLFHEPMEVPGSRGGTIGDVCLNGPFASGYEFDVVPELLGLHDGPVAGMVVLASAEDQLNFDDGLGFQTPGAAPVRQGAQIVYWDRPAGGIVVNAASISMTGALAVDVGIGSFVHNVLSHFGIDRSRG